ncbi:MULTISPECIES: hypothetical protein [unclassified Coleofasciculus]|uniref:hypothetical protein n=1 Tax=unclassified Coleofasciculus TaxID=2692782 RepID=UPI00187EC0F0|nr:MULTISPECIES: hypothetical protein [unclassified Coleofasciculus]MBE9125571.1 hypothetical protein [Coleofasciculus sp. LEGE 07081]MBE9147794.1 hypothetical protein [Coleofasciculus sp. LEGE 07092]
MSTYLYGKASSKVSKMSIREQLVRLKLGLILLWNKLRLFAKYRQKFYLKLIWVELLSFPSRVFG